MLEQLELHRRQSHILATACYTAAQSIERQVSNCNLFGDARAAAATSNQGSDPCLQLFVAHRFDYIVVRARVQSAHDRLGVGAARVEQYRRPPAASSQLLEDLESMAIPELKV